MDKINVKITPHGIARSGDIQKIADAVDLLIGMFGSMTLEHYEALTSYDERLYFIKNDRGRLIRIYYGSAIIARSKYENEEIVLGLPCELPILF